MRQMAGDEDHASAAWHERQHGFQCPHLGGQIEFHRVRGGFVLLEAAAGIQYQVIEAAKGALNGACHPFDAALIGQVGLGQQRAPA